MPEIRALKLYITRDSPWKELVFLLVDAVGGNKDIGTAQATGWKDREPWLLVTPARGLPRVLMGTAVIRRYLKRLGPEDTGAAMVN